MDWTEASRTHAAAPFVCSQSARSAGKPLDRQNARARFKVACRVLGAERTAGLTIHHGRHTFASFALARYPLPVAAVVQSAYRPAAKR